MTDAGIDRRYYELCALSELKNSLRSGDIWVQGSRQFKDFEDYLVPPAKFASLKQSSALPLAVATDCDQYLHDRLTLLEAQLATDVMCRKDWIFPAQNNVAYSQHSFEII